MGRRRLPDLLGTRGGSRAAIGAAAVEAALRHGQHGMDSGFGDLPLAVLGSHAGGAEVGGHAARAGHPIKERGVRPTDDTWHNIHMSHVGLTVEAIRATVQAALARTGTRLSSVPRSKGP